MPGKVLTNDGTYTVKMGAGGETYHSHHGAATESKYVFVQQGLAFVHTHVASDNVRLLEVGFGTGLNCLLSLAYAEEHGFKIDYTGLEPHPLSKDFINSLGYDSLAPAGVYQTFLECLTPNSGGCSLELRQQELAVFEPAQLYHLIYFDAFSSGTQPELWTEAMLGKCADMLLPGGVFVTYAITGKLKRALRAAGMTVEKLPGAPGKREMLRAQKRFGC